MIYATPGSTATAYLTGAPAGLAGTVGFKVLDKAGSTVVAHTTAGIVEIATGNYAHDFTTPSTAADYLIVWDNGATLVTEELSVTYTGTSAPSPSGVDLCTVADVRVQLGKTTADTAQDALIADLITDASVVILERAGREFIPGGPNQEAFTAATRTFTYSWADQYPAEAFLDLRPYDLRTLTSVSVDTDQASSILLSADEYRLWPLPAEDGVYMGLLLAPLNVSVGPIGWRARQVQVTGDWGFPSIPRDVRRACIFTVMYWLTMYPAAYRPDPAAEAPVVMPRGLPKEATDLLSRFKRMTVA